MFFNIAGSFVGSREIKTFYLIFECSEIFSYEYEFCRFDFFQQLHDALMFNTTLFSQFSHVSDTHQFVRNRNRCKIFQRCFHNPNTGKTMLNWDEEVTSSSQRFFDGGLQENRSAASAPWPACAASSPAATSASARSR